MNSSRLLYCLFMPAYVATHMYITKLILGGKHTYGNKTTKK